mmetsp:Transcript_26324/g.51751  ORF Transcript_26324/g.51751 Transcript_26324/m.51751 type:complete len:209 (-) Transcript_26324:376-1002(-)
MTDLQTAGRPRRGGINEKYSLQVGLAGIMAHAFIQNDGRNRGREGGREGRRCHAGGKEKSKVPAWRLSFRISSLRSMPLSLPKKLCTHREGVSGIFLHLPTSRWNGQHEQPEKEGKGPFTQRSADVSSPFPLSRILFPALPAPASSFPFNHTFSLSFNHATRPYTSCRDQTKMQQPPRGKQPSASLPRANCSFHHSSPRSRSAPRETK